jgi:hypothetical protein
MPAPTWAAAPAEVAAATAEVVEAALDSGVEVDGTDMVAMLELGVGVTELTRTSVLVMVVVEVMVVVVSVAATRGARARQREVMIVNFIAINSRMKIREMRGHRYKFRCENERFQDLLAVGSDYETRAFEICFDFRLCEIQ